MSDANQIEEVRSRFHRVLGGTRTAAASQNWARVRFEKGLRLADELERMVGPLEGRSALELGTGMGGDLLAMFARGARCVGCDYADFEYARYLAEFENDRLRFVRLDAMNRLPFADASFDVVFSMDLVEMIHDLDAFFAEIARVMKPGGVGLINTGIALKGIQCDSVYGLPGVSLLPTPVRKFVAEKIFRRRTGFRLSSHTFYSASIIARHARCHGMEVIPAKLAESPVMARVGNWPGARLWKCLLRHYAFDFVLLVPKSSAARAVHASRTVPCCEPAAPAYV